MRKLVDYSKYLKLNRVKLNVEACRGKIGSTFEYNCLVAKLDTLSSYFLSDHNRWNFESLGSKSQIQMVIRYHNILHTVEYEI